MTFKRWDVVTVHFPFLEGTDSKLRPALIVSNDRLYGEHGLYWIAMITTAKSGMHSKDIPITDHIRVGLRENCVIRVSRLMTVGDDQINRRVGTITPKDRNAVFALLRQYT